MSEYSCALVAILTFLSASLKGGLFVPRESLGVTAKNYCFDRAGWDASFWLAYFVTEKSGGVLRILDSLIGKVLMICGDLHDDRSLA